MKKTLLTNLKFIAFGIVVALGMSYVSASPWINPPANPPAGNVDTPINVSATDQIKGIAGSATGGGLSVLGFTAEQNAQFEQALLVGGIIRGDSPLLPSVNSSIKIGGTNGLGTARTVTLAMNGSLDTKDSLIVTSLANTTNNEVCADATGTLVFCVPPAPSTVCPNLSGGPYTTVPAGYTVMSDGTCKIIIAGTATMDAMYGLSIWANPDGSAYMQTTLAVPNPPVPPGWIQLSPRRLTVNFTSPLPGPVSFKWGYCQDVLIPKPSPLYGFDINPQKHCIGFPTQYGSSVPAMPSGYVLGDTMPLFNNHPYIGGDTTAATYWMQPGIPNANGNWHPGANYNNFIDIFPGDIVPQGTTQYRSGVGYGAGFVYEAMNSSNNNTSAYSKVTHVTIYLVQMPAHYEFNITSIDPSITIQVVR